MSWQNDQAVLDAVEENYTEITGGHAIIQADLAIPGVDDVTNLLVRDVVGNKTDTVAGNSLIALIKLLSTYGIKIDNLASNGLTGVVNSTSYRIHEAERHMHSAGSWFGQAAVPSGETHIADRVGPSVAAFDLLSGNNDWGAWTQILGSTDTPARAGMVFFDPHEIQVTNADTTVSLFIQFTRGDSGADGFAAGHYTEMVYTPITNSIDAGPVSVQTGRAPVGDKLWGRILALGVDAKTLSFYLGLHEYEG